MTRPVEELQAMVNFERLLTFEVASFLEERLSVERPGATPPDTMAIIAIARVVGTLISKNDLPALKFAFFVDQVRKAAKL